MDLPPRDVRRRVDKSDGEKDENENLKSNISVALIFRSSSDVIVISIKSGSPAAALRVSPLDEDAEVTARFTFAKHASYITFFRLQIIGILRYPASSESVTVISRL